MKRWNAKKPGKYITSIILGGIIGSIIGGVFLFLGMICHAIIGGIFGMIIGGIFGMIIGTIFSIVIFRFLIKLICRRFMYEEGIFSSVSGVILGVVNSIIVGASNGGIPLDILPGVVNDILHNWNEIIAFIVIVSPAIVFGVIAGVFHGKYSWLRSKPVSPTIGN